LVPTEYLGKLEFYLEALDRNVKKPQEDPESPHDDFRILTCLRRRIEVLFAATLPAARYSG